MQAKIFCWSVGLRIACHLGLSTFGSKGTNEPVAAVNHHRRDSATGSVVQRDERFSGACLCSTDSQSLKRI